MLNPFKTKLYLSPCSVRFFKKRRLPADVEDSEHLPVYSYPVKPSRSTTIFGWGLGEHGALGHAVMKKKKMRSLGDARFRTFKKPFRHTIGEFYDVKDVAAGYGFSAFSVNVKNQNKIWGSGINTDSQIGYHDGRKNEPLGILLSPAPINLNLKNPAKTKVLSLSAGRAHLVVVTDAEGVFTLGNNSYGQCGRTVIKNEKYLGSRIVHSIPCMEGGDKVKSVECGQDHTLFLTEGGSVYSCGWGADGQTGLGHYNCEPHPRKVCGDIQGEKIIKISSKCDCVLALNDKGEVFGWGNSEYSQIFDESQTQQQINRPIFLKKCQGFGKIIDVAAGGSSCIMLNENGEVFSWGYGILGRGPVVSHSWTPQLIPSVLFGKNDFQPHCKVEAVFAGLHFSGAINNYGHIYTWGKNKGCCLGLGHDQDQFFPFRVFLGARAKKLALGVDHSIALCNPF